MSLAKLERQSGMMWQLRGQPSSNKVFLNDEPLIYGAHNGSSDGKRLQRMVGKEVTALELPPVSVTFVVYAPH